jgi:hypothetical protein
MLAHVVGNILLLKALYACVFSLKLSYTSMFLESIKFGTVNQSLGFFGN